MALYSKVIIDHFRSPRNYGALPSPDVAYEGFNPLCGDRVRIELQVKDGTVQAAGFTGDACAICLAAASLLTELIVGADIERGQVIQAERLLSALQSDIKPSRMKCALLPLETIHAGIDLYMKRRSSEI